MTIDEAIKRLTRYQKGIDEDEGEPVDLDNAILLGIEALKWIKHWREVCATPGDYRLPGETEE